MVDHKLLGTNALFHRPSRDPPHGTGDLPGGRDHSRGGQDHSPQSIILSQYPIMKVIAAGKRASDLTIKTTHG